MTPSLERALARAFSRATDTLYRFGKLVRRFAPRPGPPKRSPAVEALYVEVAAAIVRAEDAEARGCLAQAAIAYRRVAKLEAAIAAVLPADDPENAIAQRGAQHATQRIVALEAKMNVRPRPGPFSSLAGPTLCRQCGVNFVAYRGAVYCGAACTARAEAGEPPARKDEPS